MFVFNKAKFEDDINFHLKGLSCRDAADICDLSAATISRIQNGSRPSLTTVVKVCMGLWIDPRVYFSRSEGVDESQMRLL